MRRRLEAAGLGDHADELVARGLPSIRLTATPAADGEIPVGASKFGGCPDVWPGFEWPVSGGRPLAFIGQMNIDELARYDEQGLLPSSGILSFFFDLAMPDPMRPGAAIAAIPGGALLERWRPPAELPEHHGLPATRVVGSPDFTLHPWPGIDLPERERGAYMDLTWYDQPRGCHRMLGHPT